jgi:hypothetical protein
MAENKLTRRQFLRGSGGFCLSLPFLPSLFSKELLASNALQNVDKCFFAMGTSHGGIDDRDMFGSVLSYADQAPSSLNKYTYLHAGSEIRGVRTYTYPTHVFHYGDLNNYLRTAAQAGESVDPDAGRERLSYIIGHKFNPLLHKMNLLRGIDLHMGDSGHQQGLFLGNFSWVQNGKGLPTAPTIDYVMANSRHFYKNLEGIRLKLAALETSNGSLSQNNGQIQLKERSIHGIFNAIFGDTSTAGNAFADHQTTVVDRVYQDYTRFLSPSTASGRRISGSDRIDLENFLTTLHEFQRRLKTQTGCSPDRSQITNYNIRNRDDRSRHPLYWENLAILIGLAFSCGSTRVFTTFIDDYFTVRDSSLRDDYHHAVAHRHTTASGRQHHRLTQRNAAHDVFYNVISILNQFSGQIEGTKMLDQSLCTWQAESGIRTHNPINNFAVTAGSAGNFFNTGKFIDFRSLQNRAFRDDFYSIGGRPGISLNQYLANILMAMGIPKSEYENIEYFGGPGYGGWRTLWSVSQQNFQLGFPTILINRAGEKIPIWTKG